jgi:predicted nucleotidyltransferase
MPKLIDEKMIQEIVRRILSFTSPQRIILFGSAATGQMTPDSDLDLLVVTGRSGRHPEDQPAPAAGPPGTGDAGGCSGYGAGAI